MSDSIFLFSKCFAKVINYNLFALRKNRLRWFGHTQRSDQWINKIQTFDVTGNAGRGRPSKTWKDVISDDIKSWTIPVASCQDHSK